METVNTVDLRSDLGEILNRVRFKCETFTIIRHGKPIAVLSPVGAQEVVSDPTAGVAAAAGPALEKKTPTEITKKPQKAGKTPEKRR